MLYPSTGWPHERMNWLSFIDVPYLDMENAVSAMQALSVKSTGSLPSLSPRRLRKRYTEEKKAVLPFGIDVRRLSDYEPVALRTRGTLGGFTSLSDLGGTDSDGYSLQTEQAGGKECILTTLTKKIGLGVYHRRRMPSPSSILEKRNSDVDEDERETWYMFYPPPPSPSLALESPRWESASSNPDSRPQTPSEQESHMEQKVANESLEAVSSPRESLSPSVQSAASTPEIIITTADVQDADYDAMDSPVEILARQYRDILVPGPDPEDVSEQESVPPAEPQLQFEFPLPISITPPRTIRKVKAHHSLRHVVDLGKQRPSSSISSRSSSSFQSTSVLMETTTITSRKSSPTPKRLSHKSHTPSPPPRESSLSFTSSSSYSYTPGYGPRRTHGRKRSPASQPKRPDEFKSHSADRELHDDVLSFYSFDYRLDANPTDGDDSYLFPRPLALKRSTAKRSSPPPDPVHWEVPPVPYVPAILVVRPREREIMGDFAFDFEQRLPRLGGDGNGPIKRGRDMNVAGMWDREGGWI